jgi:RHS repeat-associated protein
MRSSDEPMKFTGHERDFLGGLHDENKDYHDYMHARYYSPMLGRFLSVDPLRASAETTRPRSWNRYAYALSTPMNAIDPDGRLTLILHGTGRSKQSGDWARRGQPFNKAVSDTFGERALPFDWSGGNSRRARTEAARSLAAFVANRQPGEPLNIVAFSHGGNVLKEYTNLEGAQQVDAVVLLGTPQRSDYAMNSDKVSTYVNVYSILDMVQPVGAKFLIHARAGRTDPKAINIGVSTADGEVFVNHSDLYNPSVWQRFRDIFR